MKVNRVITTFVLAVIVLVSCLSAAAKVRRAMPLGGLLDHYPWPESSENLVKNPSFEEVDAAGKVLRWRIRQADRWFPNSSVARSGVRSLSLKDSHLSRYYPSAGQKLALKSGWYTMRGWLKAEKAGTNKKHAGGRLSLWLAKGKQKSWNSTAVIRGTTDWTKVERRIFPVNPGESAYVRLEAYRKPDGNILFDDIEVRRLIPPIVEGFLLYPNYRGLLFDDRSQTIRVSVTVRAEEAKTRLSDLKVRLSLNRMIDGVEFPVISVQRTPSRASFVMELDAYKVPTGDYTLRLQVFRQQSAKSQAPFKTQSAERKAQSVSSGSRDGQRLTPIFEYPAYRIVKAPGSMRSALSVYVDSDNAIVMDGKRSFVLGIYDTTGYSNSESFYDKRISKIAEAPINMYLNYWLGRAPDRALATLARVLQRYGMYYLHTVNTWRENYGNWSKMANCRGQKAIQMGQNRYTACRASSLGLIPGFAGWYTADERGAAQAKRVFDQYKTLRKYGSGGVTFIAQNRPNELSLWRDAADVVEAHKYPIFNRPEGDLSPLQWVGDFTESAQQAVEKSRPIWTVIQYFRHGSKGHWPTYDELRTMSYMAIVAGAKGLFYWSYGAKGLSWVKNPKRKEELWQRLVKVTKEIKSLEPALLSPDAPELLKALDYKTTDYRTTEMGPARARTTDRRKMGRRNIGNGTTDNGAIRVLAKRIGRTRYLFAVNNTRREVDATFTLADAASTVEVIGEGRKIVLSAERMAQSESRKQQAASSRQKAGSTSKQAGGTAAGGSAFRDAFAPYATHVYRISDK